MCMCVRDEVVRRAKVYYACYEASGWLAVQVFRISRLYEAMMMLCRRGLLNVIETGEYGR